jgi:hypothetical protein
MTTTTRTHRADNTEPGNVAASSARELRGGRRYEVSAEMSPMQLDFDTVSTLAAVAAVLLSVWLLFLRPTRGAAAPAKHAKPARGVTTAAAAVATHATTAAPAPAAPGQSLSQLVKAQGKRKATTAPSHPLFVRLVKGGTHSCACSAKPCSSRPLLRCCGARRVQELHSWPLM